MKGLRSTWTCVGVHGAPPTIICPSCVNGLSGWSESFSVFPAKAHGSWHLLPLAPLRPLEQVCEAPAAMFRRLGWNWLDFRCNSGVEEGALSSMIDEQQATLLAAPRLFLGLPTLERAF